MVAFSVGLVKNVCTSMERLIGSTASKLSIGLFTGIDGIKVLLGYDLDVKVYWLLSEMDMSTGLRLIESDEEAQIMKQVAFKVKNYVLYMDHYNSVGSNS
jgi:hypothetical protein